MDKTRRCLHRIALDLPRISPSGLVSGYNTLAAMDTESGRGAARRLRDEIKNISSHVCREGSMAPNREDVDMTNEYTSNIPRSGALPVSPPDSLAGKIIKVVVTDMAAQEDLCKQSRSLAYTSEYFLTNTN